MTVDYVGPFSYHAVVVVGWVVPFLTATPMTNGGTYLELDNRFGCEVTLDAEASTVRFIADCIAVALGFTGHPEAGRPGPKVRAPHHRLHHLNVEP